MRFLESAAAKPLSDTSVDQRKGGNNNIDEPGTTASTYDGSALNNADVLCAKIPTWTIATFSLNYDDFGIRDFCRVANTLHSHSSIVELELVEHGRDTAVGSAKTHPTSQVIGELIRSNETLQRIKVMASPAILTAVAEAL